MNPVMRYFYLFSTLICVLFFQNALGVVFHPSVPDSVKTNFRDRVQTEVRSVGYLNTGTGSCTAQPITSQILITAAHCTNSSTVQNGFFGWDVDNDGSFEGFRYIDRFVDHPGWSNDGRRSRPIAEFVDDIALLFLDEPLPDHITPYRIRVNPSIPIGVPVIVGGYGKQGTIGDVVDNNEFGVWDKQYATNVIDGSEFGKILRTDLSNRAYPGTSGAVGSFNPEGLIASGDSGGGVFTSTNFSLFDYSHTVFDFPIKLTTNTPELIAINSHGGGHFFGAEAGYVFLAPHFSWIQSQIEASGLSASVGGSSDQVGAASITPVGFSQTVMSAEPENAVVSDLRIDKFPNSSLVSIDEDDDGYPDEWNSNVAPGTDEIDGYFLDFFPTDSRFAKDSDRDGLPDEWEFEFFGSLQSDSTTDFDDDGVDDIDEYETGTDPTVADTLAPNAPEPLSPLRGETVDANASIILSYTEVAGASRYHVERYDRTLSSWSFRRYPLPSICSDEGICSIAVPGIAPQAGAIWRVRAQNSAGWGDWSWIYFNVEESEILAPPTPLSPARGDTVQSNTSLVLSYEEVSGADRYQVERYDRTTNTWSFRRYPLPNICSNDGVCSVTVPGTETQNSAFWRVRARNSFGWSDWSWITFNVAE